MWIRKPKYSVKSNLPLITSYDRLPPGAIELARIKDVTQDNDLCIFVKNNGGLSILLVSEWVKKWATKIYL